MLSGNFNIIKKEKTFFVLRCVLFLLFLDVFLSFLIYRFSASLLSLSLLRTSTVRGSLRKRMAFRQFWKEIVAEFGKSKVEGYPVVFPKREPDELKSFEPIRLLHRCIHTLEISDCLNCVVAYLHIIKADYCEYNWKFLLFRLLIS